jgi:putative ABC transport system ATP-binding protein
VIRTENLVKVYNLGGVEVRALDGVSLDIDDGEMVAITGASGSGKSTLMNILGCLDRPDGGSYWLGDEDVSKLPKKRLAQIRNQRIGFVFQTFNLLPRMTAFENVELPLLYAGNAKQVRDMAMAALKLVGLENRTHHEPNQLSGGQRQRVAIARAIVMDPTIILADEPTGNLDSRTGHEIMELFEELHAQGRTIVIVTHEPSVAQRCGRQVHMVDGKIVNGMLQHA